MRTLKNKSIQPPQVDSSGGFRYCHKESGHWSVATDHYNFYEKIKAHRIANGLPPITIEEAEDQLCATLGPDWCESDKDDPNWVNTRLSISDIVGASRIYRQWKAEGKPFVSQEETERRQKICSSCYLNVHVSGCGGLCQELIAITAEVKDLEKTGYESKLHNCAVCHCSGVSQTRFPLALLEIVDTEERQSKYPISFCWKNRQSPNYVTDAAPPS